MTSQSNHKLWRHACQLQSTSHPGPGLPPLLFLTDQQRVGDATTIARALPPGSGIILRDYDAPNRLDLATKLSEACRQSGVLFLVADDEKLAQQVGADGLHCPEYAISRIGPIRRRHPGWLITAAAHSAPAVRSARLARADAVLISPVFSTQSHPGATPMGVVRFAALVRNAGLPAYALGGVNANNTHRLRGTHATGVAAIGAFSNQ